jgi:hypothetical protein
MYLYYYKPQAGCIWEVKKYSSEAFTLAVMFTETQDVVLSGCLNDLQGKEGKGTCCPEAKII